MIGADRIVVADIRDAAERLHDDGDMSDDGYFGILDGLACDGTGTPEKHRVLGADLGLPRPPHAHLDAVVLE